jgi:hypothetical protein
LSASIGIAFCASLWMQIPPSPSPLSSPRKLTDESRNLLVVLDLLVEALNVLRQGLELFCRLLQGGKVGRGGIGTGEGVELDRGLELSAMTPSALV